MSAIQLSDGHQVERGDEEPDPSGEGHRREADDCRSQLTTVGELVDEREEERGTSVDASRVQRVGKRWRSTKSEIERRERDYETSQRSGDADVEHSTARPDERLHLDERAKGAQPHRHRDEVWKRHIHAMPPRREVVAELVNAENRQQRDCIRYTDYEARWLAEQVHPLMECARPYSCRNGRNKEHDVDCDR